MSRSLNLAIVSGYTGQDPKFTEVNGKKIANFSIAVDSSYKKDGEWVKKTVWVGITTYGPLAEYVKDNLPQGSYVEAQGRLALNTFKDKNGSSRNELFVEITQKGELNIHNKKSATAPSEEEAEAA